MSFTTKVIVQQGYVDSSLTLKYTSPSTGKGTWIDKATFTNVSGATANFTLNIVPSGGSSGADNKVISAYSLASGATASLSDLSGRYMAPGDSIYWSASAATSINGAISGREQT